VQNTRKNQGTGRTAHACRACGRSRPSVASAIGLCRQCLAEHFESHRAAWKKASAAARLPFGLPGEVPSAGERTCRLCGNRCAPIEGMKGYCGLRQVRRGKLVSLAGTGAKGILDWYYDPLPTNCCADFVCPAGTYKPAGWERYSYAQGPEHGYRNLAVFYRSCSMGCLYCQNWHFRQGPHPGGLSALDLARAVDSRTACICFFGGDPSTQAAHAIRTAQIALRRASGRILRICFETNGRWNPVLLDRAARLGFESGGCIKFDLKAWSPEVHMALTGFGPEQTRENFERLVPLFRARKEPPFLVAATLLVPGYVTEHEVGPIARWLASLDRGIPYSLLVFHPHFLLEDLPVTPRRQVEACLKAAREAGLERLHVGNLHLLKD
jgi:pyruvate formate lyase activating enzyme